MPAHKPGSGYMAICCKSSNLLKKQSPLSFPDEVTVYDTLSWIRPWHGCFGPGRQTQSVSS